MSKINSSAFYLSFLIALTCLSSKELGALPNPASENCIKQGGRLKILKRGDGGEYGVCVFPNGRQCEEWALLRADCPPGGIEIGNFVTDEVTYCLITGGVITGDPSQCLLPTGKICDLGDFYSGKCP